MQNEIEPEGYSNEPARKNIIDTVSDDFYKILHPCKYAINREKGKAQKSDIAEGHSKYCLHLQEKKKANWQIYLSPGN